MLGNIMKANIEHQRESALPNIDKKGILGVKICIESVLQEN
jgi:hypothetical protein